MDKRFIGVMYMVESRCRLHRELFVDMSFSLLIVENDENDLLLLDRALVDAGLDVKAFRVRNGVDAALYLKGEAKFADRKKFPLPGLILLDLVMPLFDGFEFLEWLRNEFSGPGRRIPVVVVSSVAKPDDIRRAYELGANSFVVKPTDWAQYRKHLCSVVTYWSNFNQGPASPG